MKNKQTSRTIQLGFTLLELLVVISIIGMLASMFVFGYAGWTDKARLANTKSFSQSIRSKVGFNVAGQWTFDDGTAKDVSGNNNNGTIYGASSVDGVMGKAMSFDGSGDYIITPTKVESESTITAWTKTVTANNRMLWCIDHDSHGPDLYFACGKILLNTWDGCSNPFCDIPVNALDNNWHHYVVVIAPNNTKLYFDGKLCGSASYKDPAGTSFYISSGIGYDWNGVIDDVAIYSEAFTVTQIQQLYVEGLSKHNLALNQK
ncbi:MAG: LamG-like jellyroll fold domain-containing protein [bacterium]|nr:LamG-like jellyroll fold domain-containing protein [bacterium]